MGRYDIGRQGPAESRGGMKCDRCGEEKPGLNHLHTTVNGVVVQDEWVCPDCMRIKRA